APYLLISFPTNLDLRSVSHLGSILTILFFQVFTWNGATSEMDWTTETDYTIDETPMISYVNVNAVLEGRRNRAKASFAKDPDSLLVLLLVIISSMLCSGTLAMPSIDLIDPFYVCFI
ncbi:hypothetical protein GIB67_005008, partial [Kingdonia uniflora]